MLGIILLCYGSLQMQRLAFKLETVVTESVREDHFDSADPEDAIGSSNGLNFAFGISAYDTDTSLIEDPRYGLMSAEIVSWGFGEEGEVGSDGPLGIHACTEEELGLVEGSSKFYPIRENSLRDAKFVAQKLKCLDDDFEISGDYNSP